MYVYICIFRSHARFSLSHAPRVAAAARASGGGRCPRAPRRCCAASPRPRNLLLRGFWFFRISCEKAFKLKFLAKKFTTQHVLY